MDDADGLETWKVKVFREHPRWDECDRWYTMPTALLNELYVTTYELRRYERPTEKSKSIQAIRGYHPNCVLVY